MERNEAGGHSGENGFWTRMSRKLVRVEPGEWGALVLAWLYFFCLLTSYYMLRPIRETMGIARGWDDLAWLMTATFVLMIPANWLFAWVASRFERRRFIPIVNRFFAVNLLLFLVLLSFVAEESRAWVGYAFYVWLSIFNLFIISIFWAFMGDVFRPSQSKRLFGFIGAGGTLGAILGAGMIWTLAEHVPAWLMMVFSLVLLECATQAMRALTKAQASRLDEVRKAEGPAETPGREPSASVMEGFRLFVSSPYLATIGVYLFISTITATFLYTEQGRIIDEALTDDAKRTEVFALIDLLTNVFTLGVQLFFTGRIVKTIGIGWALAVLPLVSLAAFVGLWIAPVVGMIIVAQVARRGLNYALARPVREMLFAPLGPDAKYKTKAFVDTFIYRTGDVTGAWTRNGLAAAAVQLGYIAVPMAAVWAGIGVLLGRMEKRVAADSERDAS